MSTHTNKVHGIIRTISKCMTLGHFNTNMALHTIKTIRFQSFTLIRC